MPFKSILTLVFCVLISLPVWGQYTTSPASEHPPAIGQTDHKLYFYDASNNLEYVCWTQQVVGTNTWAITGGTLTNIVDSSNTATATTGAAHGLSTGATVVVAGSTGDTDLNGTYTITVTGTTTFTFTTASVTDATYTTAGMTITNTGPKDTDAIWSIQKYFYNASNFVVKSAWASGSPVYSRICANKATYQYR